MANMDISPEDREILAKTKFKQWFDECFQESFGTAFDGRFNDVASLGGHESSGTTSGVTSSGKTVDDATPSHKRRSILSMSLEQALGL